MGGVQPASFSEAFGGVGLGESAGGGGLEERPSAEELSARVPTPGGGLSRVAFLMPTMERRTLPQLGHRHLYITFNSSGRKGTRMRRSCPPLSLTQRGSSHIQQDPAEGSIE